MDLRTIKDLEFNLLIDRLVEETLSEEGAKTIRDEKFLFEENEIKRRQDIIDDLIYLHSLDIPKPQRFCSVEKAVKELEFVHSSLDGQQLYSVASYIESAQIFSDFCRYDDQRKEALAKTLFNEISLSLKEFQKRIFDELEAPGFVKSTHPAIVRLTKIVEKKRKERNDYSFKFLEENRELSGGEQPVFRNERVVLPLRSEHKSRVAGIVHSYSNTKATMFMEPSRLVELNNSFIEAQQAIEIEIRKILSELSKVLHSVKESLYSLLNEVAFADSLFARSRFAIKTNSHRPSISENKDIIISNGRHLLLKERAVPISLVIKDGIKGLILSGPNAGGKTVTIKTVGLLVLMHQFFYYIPASEGSSLPLFNSVYTDIGDLQSIEESLSTFSAHMKNIARILKVCDEKSLLIFDELGSGTDPLEGSSLARAILDYSIKKGALILITSHHNSLKQYAYLEKELLNASMEFDDRSHRPTYRIIEGLPGSSYALESAKAMDLPKEVIADAKILLGSKALELSSIIKSLEQREKEISERLSKIESKEHQQKELSRKIELQKLELKQKELFLRQKQIASLELFIREKRSELENLVTDLKEGELNRQKTKGVKSFIKSLEDKKDESEKTIEALKKEVEEPSDENEKEFEVGMSVLVKEHNKEGQILRKEKDGSYLVAVGVLKLTLESSQLKQINKQKTKVSVSFQSSSVAPKTTVDVRGLTLSEALEVLKRQIEASLVHSLQTFSIIHGTGDGILSRGIHSYLQNETNVKSFYFARSEDGGYGKTYIEF